MTRKKSRRDRGPVCAWCGLGTEDFVVDRSCQALCFGCLGSITRMGNYVARAISVVDIIKALAYRTKDWGALPKRKASHD